MSYGNDNSNKPFERASKTAHTNIITIDGGYTNVVVKEDFPSSTIAFFQFGALFFKYKDLFNLNLDIILHNVAALKCDLYYNSLVPVVMANKLVSLADHPSADLLKSFAQENIR